MATYSGGEIRLFLSTDNGTTYKAFAAETECSFEMNAETREVTSKDIALFRSYVTSAQTWSVTGTTLFEEGALAGLNTEELYDLIGDKVKVKIAQVQAGTQVPASTTTQIIGDAILTQFSVSAADKDNASASFTLNGTGAFAASIVP